MAAAFDEAWAWRTLSVKTSEVIGGREVTRRFRLYRLGDVSMLKIPRCTTPFDCARLFDTQEFCQKRRHSFGK